MTAPPLARLPYDVDVRPRDGATGECWLNPGWDIDPQPNGAALNAAGADRIRQAAAGCRRCPLWAACDKLTATRPPGHTSVAAGRVWDGGRPVDVETWIAAAMAGPVIPERRCERARCGGVYQPRRPGQRFCSARCRRYEQCARHNARKARP